ncbi:hypothetical protein PHABIO_394 [Pseudomonas phage Phabio]|uniref:Uncharacterized protein n=1 Tax=Pseudomonas phage Phabio TaxID=2006668 RepID=A0A1Y0SWY9_9CAUD|nr:hypothetical protein MZD05_gp394 [Pseudomonas phage Phabio]ARV77025.1 hypothetical protein PHABIO_394 [Pseudomonas phage Phabio]
MDNRVKLVKQPDKVWTVTVDGVQRLVTLDETPLIVWKTLGLHPDGVVEVYQTSSGVIEKFVLLPSEVELTELEFTKQHSLYRAMNIRGQYVGG